jgi:hypothetical protein
MAKVRRRPRLTRAVPLFFLACSAGSLACTAQILGDGGSDSGSVASGSGAGSGVGSGAGGSSSAGTGGGLGSTPEEVDAACEATQGKLDVGLTRLRRLTRVELDNTVRSLFGIEARGVETIAPDERIGPFSSNAIAPPTDLLIEQYQELAERVALEAGAQMAEIAPCNLAADTTGTCATEFVKALGARAFRRPLVDAEVAAYVGLYDTVRQLSDAAGGFTAVVEGLLQSPFFLYHSDASSPGAPSATPVLLDQHALASRLSYFLWGTMPDAELFSAADAGTLADPTAVSAQVTRLLSSPRAVEAIANFHAQWLGFADLSEKQKDPAIYPDFNQDVSLSMLQETTDFTRSVVLEGDGLLKTLLTSNLAFPRGPLFELYGVTQPVGFLPGTAVALDATRRSGILTQAAFLTRHAHGNQTSPVHRGILVRENLLCQPIDPPPANVAASPPPPTPATSTRERFAQHVADGTCAGCHSLIDPIGLGFEHYDAVGAYREVDGQGPVDASGEFTNVRDDLAGTFTNAVELTAMLAESGEVADCVSRQWFRFSLGRVESKSDACSVRDIQTGFNDSDHNIRSLLTEIVTSDAFRYVRSTGGDMP